MENACLRESHVLFVVIINFNSPKLGFRKGSNGIAITATRSGFRILLGIIIMLQLAGSTLSVDVLLETRDGYEPKIYDSVLSELNATCIVLPSLLVGSEYDFEIAEPQLWSFALLFSSFESVLFLDASSSLLRSSDALFHAKAFSTDGLVLWQSVGKSSISS
ncbi:hypothetical protein VTL71DRAFT_5949 [Oculimacula yallundae]|uniref:Uncharacterized protein n=1 Tax=Oculimacula yallundae TaxID=86028 RepID=A0ABR4BZN6_9HELO